MTHKTQGDSKVYFLQRQTRLSLNYGEHNPSHVRRYPLPSQLSHNSISSLYSQHFPTRLAAPKQTKCSMLQIKTIPKNISTIGILLLHPSFINNYTLSEEATQREHTHARYNSSLLKLTNIPIVKITTKPSAKDANITTI